MSQLLNHRPSWLHAVLKVCAGILLPTFIATILLGIGALVAIAESDTTKKTTPTAVSSTHEIATSVQVTAQVPFNTEACDGDPTTGNYHTTLKRYDGDEDAMLADFGFTKESFTEYCQTLD